MVLNRKSMLRCLCLVLACVLVFPVVANAAETTLVRRDADSSSTVVAQMTEGTILNVVEETGSFYKVDCYNMHGYIAKEQVSHSYTKGYYVRCAREDQTSEMEFYSYAEALELRHSILEMAASKLGTPYVYGGTGSYGFDCSGFVYSIYGNHGFDLMRCADEQMRNGIAVSKDGLQAGDLVFFRDPYSPWLATHVGIYVGNNQMIHASTSKGITYDSLDMPYYAERYVGARRIINADTTEITRLPSASAGMFARSITVAPSLGIRSVK